jgi:hypothetical protein
MTVIRGLVSPCRWATVALGTPFPSTSRTLATLCGVRRHTSRSPRLSSSSAVIETFEVA